MLDSFYRFTSAFIDVLLRIVYLPFAVVAWVFSLLPYVRVVIFAAILIVLAYFHARYSNQIVDNTLFALNRVAAPYYQNEWRPILGGIIRQFFNRFVCWYNAFLWFPYGYGREVLFPILRESGFGTTVTNFANFLKQFTIDWFLGYLLNGRFFTEEMDFQAICDRWMGFWQSWQSVVCYGCNDLCPFFTKLPIIPMVFTSDQLRDQAFWNFVSDGLNGWFVFSQQVIYIIRDVLFPINVSSRKRVSTRADFRRAFDLWVSSGSNFWRSFENILNAFWVEFIPFAFDWTDVLQIFNIFFTMTLRFIQLLIDVALNGDKTLDHFSGVDSTYWIESVKEDYKVIIGLLAVASYFDDIPLVGVSRAEPSSVITNYELRPTQPSLPNGKVNPLFNQVVGSSYACIVLERVICDPENLGVGCSQRFAGTLLEDVDICCPVNTLLGVSTDFMAFLFEFSLHLRSSDDFVRYTDKQPFTTQFKERIVDFLGCAFMYFRVVRNYGFCIERVLFELTNFVVCTGELLFRVLVAIVTLPYYQQFLPGEVNFISAGDNCNGTAKSAPVDMAVEFLDRIADETTVDGFINCFSYLMNTGFMVSFAGCNKTSCIPSGFQDPSGLNKRQADYKEHRKQRIRGFFGSSFYNLTTKTNYYSHELTPIMRYGDQKGSISFSRSWSDYQSVVPTLFHSMKRMSANYHDVHAQWSKQKCNQPTLGKVGVCGHPDLVFQRVMGNDELEWNPFRYDNMPMSKRLVTQAPLEQIDCPTPDTVAPCFDLSCLFTKVIQLLAHTVAFTVRALNEFVLARTADGSGYFNGDCCTRGEPCLESDLVMLVVKFIDPLRCVCEFVKLLIPNRGGFRDPCCAFTVAGELASCIVQILINIGNSINGDAPNYTYIKDPAFLINDFNIVLRISLALFDCACDFVRAIFAVALSGSGSGQDLIDAFDPCCFLRTLVRAVLALAKMLFRVVLSIATLDREDSQCYMYVRTPDNVNRTNCPDGVPQLGAMRDFSDITVALFAVPGEGEVRECGVLRDNEDPDQFGAATCYCRLINSLLTMVFKFVVPEGMDPMQVTQHNQTIDNNTPNTCVIDLCCPVYRISSILKGSIDFLAQLTWTFIQNWEDRSVDININGMNVTESFYLPQETFEFFFCDEYGPENYFVEGTINTFSLENGGTITNNSISDVYTLSATNSFGMDSTASVTFGDEVSVEDENPNVLSLSNSAIPNFDGDDLSSGIPSLTQNAPFTGIGQYGPVSGIINTATTVTDAQRARDKCGKLEPVIIGIYNLLGRCVCPGCHQKRDGGGNENAKGLGNSVDKILRYSLAWVTGESTLFPFQLIWPNCLCCGGPDSDPVGMAVPFASAFTVAIRQILILLRNIPNPSYWTPAGSTLAGGSAASNLADNLEDIKKTWISRFLAPFADASCRFVTNSGCLLTMLLGDTCAQGSRAPLGNDYDIRYKVISSLWRYTAEALIRAIAVLEGMIKLFTQELPGQCIGDPKKTQGNADQPEDQGSDGANVVPTCSQDANRQPKNADYPKGSENPLDARNIGRILVALITFVFDAIIGVGALGCTQVCPGLQFASDAQNAMTNATCSCYNLSPYVGIVSSVCSFEQCDSIFNGDPSGEIREVPTFQCMIGGVPSSTCSADQALEGHTGLTTDFVDELTSYQAFREGPNGDKCNAGCSNMTEGRNIVWSRQGTTNWEDTYGPENAFRPRFYQGNLACQADISEELEQVAQGLYGANFRSFPNVNIPADGSAQSAKCACYSPIFSLTTTNTLDGRTWSRAPPNTTDFGCGFPYGNDVGIPETEATQSVCPSLFLGTIPIYPRVFDNTFAELLEVNNAQLQYERCNQCLINAEASGGFQCVTWTTPSDPASDMIRNPTACPSNEFVSVACSSSLGQPCNDATRELFFNIDYNVANPAIGGCCIDRDVGGTCVSFNVTHCDWLCTTCMIPHANMNPRGQPAPASVQPVCDRDFCISKGWCKNDQLVPCARGYNQPILDGVAIVTLKYVRCLLRNLFNNLGVAGVGDFLGEIITFILHFLSIIWQLSGGIIRFSVALFVFSLQLLQGISSGNAVTGFFKATGFFKGLSDVFNAFAGIFTQPVVLWVGPGRSVSSRTYARRYCTENNITDCEPLIRLAMQPHEHQERAYHNQAGIRNFQESLREFMAYPEGHKCIDEVDPQKCICRTVETGFCKYDAKTDQTDPPNIDLKDMIRQVSYIFSDDTICEEVWKSLNDDFESNQLTAWRAIPYARRVEAVECLTKRARGESYTRGMPEFPRSYFYDTRGTTRLIDNIIERALREVGRFARHQEDRIKIALHQLNTTHSFEKRFRMTHTQYLQSLNRRAHYFRAHLKHSYGMNEHSIMLEPLLHLDSFYYRYKSGYWGHLLGRAYNLYQNGDASLMITGSVMDVVHEGISAMDDISRAWDASSHHVHAMGEELNVMYRGIMEPTKSHNTDPKRYEYPKFPFTWNYTAFKRMLPVMDTPSFNWGPKPSIEVPDILPNIRWTEKVTYNWGAAKRIVYSVIHTIWPEYTSQHTHERFIIAGNCRAMDGLITLGTEVADYCIAEFIENTPTDREDPLFGRYWRETRAYRGRKFTNETHEWRTGPGDGDWKRPVLRNQRYNAKKYQTRIDRLTYKRSAAIRDASGQFNLYEFFIDLVERIFGIDLRQSRDNFFMDFASWVRNTNIKPEEYPNVGALYWLTFQIRCEWPENLNCSIGVGLREALKIVTIYWAIIIFAISLILPGLLTIFAFVFSLVGYVIAVSTVAWHYSFGCTIMFPSTAISPFMFTVPILPFPVNVLPALPECLWDELVALADDIFATSYAFISPSLFNMPDGTGFVNCYEIGISDGLKNVLFLGYYYFGNWFVDLLLFISTTTVGRIIPGLDSYVTTSLTSFRTASETQTDRQLFCAWWTLPSVILPALLLWLAASLFLVLIPALLALLTTLFTLIPTLPFYDALTRPGEPSGFMEVEGENSYPIDEDDEEEEEEEAITVGTSIWGKASRKLERWVMPHQKTE